MNVNDQFARSGVLVLVGIPTAIELTCDDMSRCRSGQYAYTYYLECYYVAFYIG